MKTTIYAILSFLMGCGGGIVAEQIVAQYATIGWWLLGLGGGGILCLGIFDIARNICKRIWVGRNDWTIDSSYKKSEPIGLFKGSWVSNDIQKERADIVIDISKGHERKGRLISHIRFIQGIKYRWAYPKKWKVTLTNETDSIIPEWDSRELTESHFGDGIYIELAEPHLLRNIAIVIVEPKPEGDNSPTHARCWGFSDIRITEIRFPWLPKWRLLKCIREWIIK